MRVPRLAPTLTALALAVSAALVVMLTLQLRSLRETIGRERLERVALRGGMFVPAFQGVTLTGEPVAVVEGAADGRQVLFLYNSSCAYCLENIPAWKELAERLQGASVQVYGISPDSADVARRYAAEHGLNYPTVLLHARNLQAMFHAGWVPQTVVLDGEGQVLHARLGVLRTPVAADSVLAAATAGG